MNANDGFRAAHYALMDAALPGLMEVASWQGMPLTDDHRRLETVFLIFLRTVVDEPSAPAIQDHSGEGPQTR